MNPLNEITTQNRSGYGIGIPSFCTAHPFVLETAVQLAVKLNFPLLVEATSNQVNQFGGYTGMRPVDFKSYLSELAGKSGLPETHLILGGDHLGPNPWQMQPAEQAMAHAEQMVKEYVQAGFTKIHLDASMKLGGDDPLIPLYPEVAANRSARLARAAQSVCPKGTRLVYVIGTEVPVPGGAREHEESTQVTKPEDVLQTIELTEKAFTELGIPQEWGKVAAVVVQPGVEFGDDFVLNFNPEKTQELSAFIETQPDMVYEAHSTDYQTQTALKQMVQGHFAILKVGPALTFAYREAVFALAQIEQEWLPAYRQSHLLPVIESVMQSEDEYWRNYYHGSLIDQAFARKYSLSDRIRYYWPDKRIQAALRVLITNLAEKSIPIPLLSQYLPKQLQKIQDGQIQNKPKDIIEDHICREIEKYIQATSISGSSQAKI